MAKKEGKKVISNMPCHLLTTDMLKYLKNVVLHSVATDFASIVRNIQIKSYITIQLFKINSCDNHPKYGNREAVFFLLTEFRAYLFEIFWIKNYFFI